MQPTSKRRASLKSLNLKTLNRDAAHQQAESESRIAKLTSEVLSLKSQLAEETALGKAMCDERDHLREQVAALKSEEKTLARVQVCLCLPRNSTPECRP